MSTLNLTQKIQQNLINHNIGGILIPATDKYLNEYVPEFLSIRTQITNFDGSMGDALILPQEAHLFVDGRYTLQAQSQAPKYQIHTSSSNQTITQTWLEYIKHKINKNSTLMLDPQLLELKIFAKLKKITQQKNIKLNFDINNILENLDLNNNFPAKNYKIWQANKNYIGLDIRQKLDLLATYFKYKKISCILVTKLDDIAWITNLRSNLFPYQSAPVGIAAVFPDFILFGLNSNLDYQDLPKNTHIKYTKEKDFFSNLKQIIKTNQLVGLDQNQCSKNHEAALKQANITLEFVASPISDLKARKNEKELLHLREAFKKADQVVYQTQNFVIDAYEKNTTLRETDVDQIVKENFNKSGAKELSFRPICASGKNGAIIHYGTPNPKDSIEPGALFLLDTGAYYQGGYATDLTRTFIAAPKNHIPEPWQQEIFTLVLKASIKGLSARFKRGTVGMQLDAWVREPLWQRGLDFAHGTGHGVGVNVHESPPRIAPNSATELFERQVFSIEPGLYFKNLGGVRIENLVSVVADPENSDFLRIQPLTFCPLDSRLINYKILTNYEKNFLDYFKTEFENSNPWPNLPPLPTTSLINS